MENKTTSKQGTPDWAERNTQYYGPIRKPQWDTKYRGADWIESVTKLKLGPFATAVADLLGQWDKGIYHLQKEVLHKRVEWDNERLIEVVLSDRLCTHDNNALTRLVFLCHDYGIRIELAGAAPGYMRITFYNPEKVALIYPHPTLEEAKGLYRFYEGGKENNDPTK